MLGDSGNIKLILFDVDGTITKSASRIEYDMAVLLYNLKPKIGFISGTGITELLSMLESFLDMRREAYILPEMGISCWSDTHILYDEGHPFPKPLYDRLKLYTTIAMDELGIIPVASDVFQLRHSQMTVSILGRSAPHGIKAKVDPKGSIRRKLIHRVHELMKKGNERHIPNFQLGGTSSIDIQESPWDKRDGVMTFLRYMEIKPAEALFVGDNLHPGGNDWPVTYTGVDCIKVTDPANTRVLLERGKQ